MYDMTPSLTAFSIQLPKFRPAMVSRNQRYFLTGAPYQIIKFIFGVSERNNQVSDFAQNKGSQF